MKGKNQKVKRKTGAKLRGALIMLLVAVFSISGIICVNAATIKDDGKYSLVLRCIGMSEGTIDGETSKIVKFDVADGEDSVSIAELTKGIVPFDGEHEFSHWSADFSDTSKADDEIPISKFNSSGNVYLNDGTEVEFNNGFFLYGVFSDKPLKGTGTYYLNLDAFGGTIKDKSVYQITSKSNEFKTVDLTQYVPVREGYTFVGWDLNGEFVTEISADCFKESDAVKVLATYINNTFDDKIISLTLNANGGTLDGKESGKYNYIGGRDSGAEMSLLPYVPVREGYTFNGWNTKKDGSGNNYKYVFWRIWDNNEVTNNVFDKDTLITEDSGYERYKNVTLYASWTKDADAPTKPEKPEPPTPITPPASETVNKLESTGETKAVIEFPDGINKNYRLDIREVEVKKDLADKNVKFIADINVLDGDTVVKISDTKMKIKLALPESLKGYEKYEVVYILNGEIKETIPATVEDGYIVFETAHLSQYGIAATSKSVTNVNIPKTGNTNSLALWLTMAILSGGAVTLFGMADKKKKTGKVK